MVTSSTLQTFRNEINGLLDHSILNSFFNRHGFLQASWYPDIDIVEYDSQYELQANLPGIDKKDVDISFNNGTLIIKGKSESKKEEKGENYIQSERKFGSFSRTFSFADVDKNANIEVEFKNGVLKMRIPKSKPIEARRIEIP